MSPEKQKTFKEKILADIKLSKKLLYLEEFKSFVSAFGFAANVACLTMFPFTGWSVLNIVAVYYCIKQFKPTIKKQIQYHEHLKLLRAMQEKKVWTINDKK